MQSPADTDLWNGNNNRNKCDLWTFFAQTAEHISTWFRKMSDKFEESVNNVSISFIKPKYDVVELDDCFYIRVEISGIDKDSLYTSINDRAVCVYMKKKRPIVVAPHQMIYSNRTYGMCKLYVVLPNNVQHEHIYTIYDEGILTLIFYKKALSSNSSNPGNFSMEMEIEMEVKREMDYLDEDNDNRDRDTKHINLGYVPLLDDEHKENNVTNVTSSVTTEDSDDSFEVYIAK
jgi:HSP20 family molecular chaperone IbpA